MKISARNCLQGKVVQIREGSETGNVVLDIGQGNRITSTISMEAIRDLGLKVGDEASAIIKASSVMIGVE